MPLYFACESNTRLHIDGTFSSEVYAIMFSNSFIFTEECREEDNILIRGFRILCCSCVRYPVPSACECFIVLVIVYCSSTLDDVYINRSIKISQSGLRHRKTYLINSMKQSPSWEAVTQMSRNSQPFMETESSLSCSQEPTTGHYPESGESTLHLTTSVLDDPF
jgi:hypothetical protein